MDAWKLGLKAVAIYRDNCKVAQPLSMAKKDGQSRSSSSRLAQHRLPWPTQSARPLTPLVPGSARQMPTATNCRQSATPRPSNLRSAVPAVTLLSANTTTARPASCLSVSPRRAQPCAVSWTPLPLSVSYGLQYGVPLKKFVRTFTNTSFAPAGITDDPDIRTASSLIDYIFRRLAITYLNFDDRLELGLANLDDMPEGQTSLLGDAVAAIIDEAKDQVETVLESLPQTEGSEIAAASTRPARPSRKTPFSRSRQKPRNLSPSKTIQLRCATTAATKPKEPVAATSAPPADQPPAVAKP